MSLPYSSATAGGAALDETKRLLRRFGCEQIGVHEDHKTGKVTLQFEHRDRIVRLQASIEGYAALLMKDASPRKRWTLPAARQQADIAVWSMMRDAVKGNLQMIETGFATFDQVFLANIVTSSGKTVLESIEGGEFPALPAPNRGES